MEQQLISSADRIRKLSLSVILSIILFIIFYTIVTCIVIGLTIGLGYVSFLMVATDPNTFTILLAGGVISFGLAILLFLIKFIFKKNILNTDLFIEVSEINEPKLFKLVKTIANSINTSMPKKVFISPDVNAAVTFNSNFLSLFFPSRKNLIIGLGLVNSTTADEFKAVLAHEFGHFSQGSMRVGSYAYYANYALHNMLYDNIDYYSIIKKWARVHRVISFFIAAAVKVVQGLQWILKRFYSIVNRSYSKLSIEMEFQSDSISANIAGSRALITSLLRLDLAASALSSVINYYTHSIKEPIKTINIYPQQRYVIDLFARTNKINFENNLPLVNLSFTNRFNKSKLKIGEQWASHPTLKDRVANLEKLNITTTKDEGKPASEYFVNISAIQEKSTNKVFSYYKLNKATCVKDTSDFVKEFTREYESNQINGIFNNYYNEKGMSSFNPDQIILDNSNKGIADLFNDEMTNLVYTSIALRDDIAILNNIANNEIKIKSFDYDGVKYNKKQCRQLITRLEQENYDLEEKIKNNDIEIYKYFFRLAEQEKTEGLLKEKYLAFLNFHPEFKEKIDFYIDIIKSIYFMQQPTPFKQIEEGIKILKEKEDKFKKYISRLLKDEIYKKIIKEDQKKNLYLYLAEDWIYFENKKYNNEAIKALSQALHAYHVILLETFYQLKKDILNFEVDLIKIKD